MGNACLRRLVLELEVFIHFASKMVRMYPSKIITSSGLRGYAQRVSSLGCTSKIEGDVLEHEDTWLIY